MHAVDNYSIFTYNIISKQLAARLKLAKCPQRGKQTNDNKTKKISRTNTIKHSRRGHTSGQVDR